MFITQLFVRAYVSILAFMKNREAASAIEYAIVAAMVAVVIVGFMGDIGTQVGNIFTSIKDGLTP
ncbi:Flp family type IVb pilin [Pseudomonas sp. LJDD11]|uniref:Flp family type IVb pilin n=1 Tax=unclassified Pseudomonas TaxID=196821 RepID=UPI0004F6C28F|nr:MULTISPECIES: Flp family type IVb pilin [unclassified Pseudomonas]MCQ9425221.1 Flp family type IVb pilin [Pseudomonas sp. LJDD11]BAP41820.1 Flp/Fap pilin component [Pseudomonas sp. StFLB209]